MRWNSRRSHASGEKFIIHANSRDTDNIHANISLHWASGKAQVFLYAAENRYEDSHMVTW